MDSINLTPMILSILTALAAAVTIKVIPVLKEKLSYTQRQSIYAWVKIAVKAAEQLCKDGRLDPEGRKDQVEKDVKAWLQKNNIIIDFNEIDKMIESVVSELPKTFLKQDEGEEA